MLSTIAIDTPSFIIKNSTGKPIVTIQNDANDASGPFTFIKNLSGDDRIMIGTVNLCGMIILQENL